MATSPTTKQDQTEAQPRPSNRAIVMQAITDLCDANRQASRGAIVELTGLRLSIVDEHVKSLKEEGRVRSPVAGVFEPVDVTPDRAVSGTVIPSGRFKLEIGDHVIDLTLREARNVALVTHGTLSLAAGWLPPRQ